MGAVKKDSLKLIYVVFPAKFSLKKPVTALLKKKLIVCANVIRGMESHYVWNGKVEKSKETVVIFKSLAAKEKALIKAISEIHPYEVPFVAVISPESVNAGYLDYAVQQQS